MTTYQRALYYLFLTSPKLLYRLGNSFWTILVKVTILLCIILYMYTHVHIMLACLCFSHTLIQHRVQYLMNQ